jgi:glycosyltransferase involved in cell wall biosynthesis
MNVLYVCADRGIPLLGNKGASVHVRSIVSAMSSRGHAVTLVVRGWGSGNAAPRVHRIERLEKDGDDAALLLEGLIRAERPDVVIERYSLQSGAARTATRSAGLPLTLEVNAPLVEEARRYRGLEDPAAEEREHRTFRDADRIQVVSSALLRYVESVAPGVPAAWIPNGADVERFRRPPAATLAGLTGRTVVGFVGSMKPWHGVAQLLEAFARVRSAHPEAMLVLVGAGPEEADLLERARCADLAGSVVIAGAVPHAEVPPLIARFDVAVAPYLLLERFYFNPLKIIEYLAAGKAVVYADQGDLRALVGPGGVGYAPGSIDELAGRLLQVLGDAALRSELAAAAATRGTRLDWSVVAERVLGFAAGRATDGHANPVSSAAVTA